MRKPYRKQPSKKLPSAVQLTIEGIAANGDGYGYHDKNLWYVPYTIKGDVVMAEPIKAIKNNYQAAIQTWVSQSPERNMPICPLFEQCGGCKLQHLAKEQYQLWKKQQLLEILKRQNIDAPAFDQTCFLPAATRRRVTFALSDNYDLSFHHQRSHKLITVQHCPLLTDDLNQALPLIQAWLKQYGTHIGLNGQIHLCQLNQLEMTIISQQPLPIKAIKAFTELQKIPNLARLCWKQNNSLPQVILQSHDCFVQYDQISIPTPPMPFLQASLQGEQFLQQKVLEYAEGSTSIIELFCGIGTFSFPLAMHYKNIHALDIAGDAINLAQIAAKKQQQHLKGRLIFSQRDLFKQPLLPSELKQATIILDPPRAGAIEAIQQIARSDVKHIVMVSCNPKSFSRDVALLQQSGFYLEKLSLLDQFIYTPHTELIAKLCRV